MRQFRCKRCPISRPSSASLIITAHFKYKRKTVRSQILLFSQKRLSLRKLSLLTKCKSISLLRKEMSRSKKRERDGIPQSRTTFLAKVASQLSRALDSLSGVTEAELKVLSWVEMRPMPAKLQVNVTYASKMNRISTWLWEVAHDVEVSLTSTCENRRNAVLKLSVTAVADAVSCILAKLRKRSKSCLMQAKARLVR